jgi:cyclic beta-1,2-glucan synthetase
MRRASRTLAMFGGVGYSASVLRSHDRLRTAGQTVGRILRGERPLNGNGNGTGNGAEEQPLRAELLSVRQLEEHAKSLAGWHQVQTKPGGADRLLPRLTANEAVLREAYELVSEAVKRGRQITPAAEWFLDNYHLIEEQIRTARRHLPKGYSRDLPRLINRGSAEYPRVYDIALELISHADGRVDGESLRAFVASYQSLKPFRLGELWAIPIMLRLALLENLRRVAARVMAGRLERERASYWVEQMLEVAAKEPAKVVLVLAELVKENPPLTNAFVAEFASRLQGQGPALIFAMTWLEQRLSEQGQSIEQVFQQASQSQAADQVSIGNSIGSLRFLGATEWRDFVESMSVVEQTLRGDPSGVYAVMDFATRDRYRHAVEDIAKLSPLSEDEVARSAVELARGATTDAEAKSGSGPRAMHVGYFLIDRGRRTLERSVRMQPRMSTRLRRVPGRFAVAVYLFLIAAVSVLTAVSILGWTWKHGLGMWGIAMSAVLLVVCTSQLGIALVHWAAALLVRPRILPRMNFSAGIPSEHRTIVAVPTLLTDAAEIDDLLEALEVRFLANRDPNLHFALLSDFRDAEQEKMPGDDALLDRARVGIQRLNLKYGRRLNGTTDVGEDAEGQNGENVKIGGGDADQDRASFFLFHRARRWNASEGVWMGWERKRGKLEEFNVALRGDTKAFAAIVGPIGSLRGIKYVITLDSDTQLPRDSAAQLVGTMAHPLNRPQYDEKLGRVVEGYSILQPRVGITMPSASRSRFSRLFAGEPGIDPYTRAVSDVYQDVFREGSFIGKGIYDLDALQQAIGGRFPENRILSHDLLEGAYARAGLISDVVLFEDFPAAYTADVSRRYRWIRGDWQIVPWMLPRVPGASNGRELNTISSLSRWKIFDNIRRSLVPIALLGLLLLGWFLPGGALFYTGVVVAILLLPALLTAATELARRPADLPREQHGRLVIRTLSRQVVRESFALVCLPYDAFISADAIARTAARVLVTGRKLLEWRTASDAQRSARSALSGFYISMWVLPVMAVSVCLMLGMVRPHALDVAAPVLGLWLFAPSIAWWMSRPIRAARPRLSDEDTVFLRTVARRTWRFFEAFVGPTDNFLPPDNYQEDPPQGAAHRTSPTNIGLALLSNLTAYDFGYISISDLIQRTTRTFDSVDKLQRYRGHLYNWYDTRTLDPLRPLYVSTVDSGNLAGHLLTLAAGLKLMDAQPLFRREVFSGLGETLDVVAEIARGDARGSDEKSIPQSPRSVRERIVRIQEYLLRAGPHGLSSSSLLLKRLAAAASDLTAAIQPTADGELKWWAEAFENQCRQAIVELHYLAPWIELPLPRELMWKQGSAVQISRRAELRDLLRRLDDVPTLSGAAGLELSILPAVDAVLTGDGAGSSKDPDGDEWLRQLRAAIVQGSERAAQRVSELRQLASRCIEFADIDYDFLYDKHRHLLAIGFNVGEHRLDPSFYDLLASEARLASFIAIAQGKLPQEHWFSLGRLLTNSSGKPALLSWSGSMFEYVMPLLVMPTYDRTLLDETYRAVVERQIEYGRERGVPWGVSESGYSKTDAQLNYQYRAFGVPGLGFKRGLADDVVVAPYASAMALMVEPEASCANLRRLAREGLLGPYGFYEAVDYTPARMPRGQESVTVQSYMVHHQGMAFLSLAYLLLDRPMQRRFMSDPAFQATNLLLQERVPRTAAVFPHPAEVTAARGTPADAGTNYRVFNTPNTPAPDVHLLSNGRYHVMVTAAGGGYSRWRDFAVTRWHEDSTRDGWGSFCYLRDVETGEFWSVAHQPTLKRATTYEAIYSQGKAEFRRRDGDIETHVEISVSPEDDIELRRVSVTNHGRVPHTIEITSFAEVVLSPPAADAAHPAFSKLFVQTQLVRERHAILCTRRPRSGAERPPWMMHLMTVYGAVTGGTSYETGRGEFIGRGRTVADPAAMSRSKLTDSEGSVLDPAVAVRNTVVIAPGETARAHLVTGVSETREGALGLIEKYHDRHLADRVFELAWTHSQVVHGQLDATEADTQLFGRLASSILYANPLLRATGSVISRNRQGQSGLWGYGISGDLPIVLLRIADQAQIQLVRQLVQAHTYWRVKGLSVDLVIWNEDQSGYRQVLQDQIMGMIASRGDANLLDKPGGIFVRRSEQMSEEDKVLMQTVARVIISDTAGTLAEQVDRRPRSEPTVPRFNAIRKRQAPVKVAVQRPDLIAFNGIGGFTQDGREYVITTTGNTRTPAPWVNVIANPWFGTVVSESGGAYTWCENAHGYRLTPWNNDPISDPSGEMFYLRDEESGRFWSPTPQPARGPMPYATRHGFGYSIFEYTEDGITTEMWTYVATDAPVKFTVIKMRNNSGRPRRLSATGIFELVLGSHRAANLLHIVTEVDPKSGALLARNAYNTEFNDRVAFLDTSEAQRTVTGDRNEFFGRNGSTANPAGMLRSRLSGRVGAGLDPCAAMQVMVDLADGEEREIAFTFGSGRDLTDARNLVNRFRGTGPARAALEGVWGFWNRTLGAVYVQTPDASLNFLANGWLLYQVLSCRMWARSGFYQSGGAFGFRDQLQDAMSLAHTEPGILREQLLKSAAHQFREGDVQHWWHPPQGRGVRTRISDDYLWLPYATCRYVEALGDTGVLDEVVRFIDGRLVKPDEESYYDLPGRSEESATLYEHCVRAVKNGLRFGEHGLPLMGCGDWNDGMNLVGEHGKGESVWLAFFLYDVLNQFGKIARQRNDTAFADLCASEAIKLQQNIENSAWDGEWYRRAYFDNGEPLGSVASPECKIDSLPQSWAILSGAGDPDRAHRALDAVDQKLVNRKLGVIQLFDPPFDTSNLNPGYIKGYVPGVRENGGQYTHAAVWAAMAFAAAGDAKRAWELFHLINPVRHGDSVAAIAQYKVEPYVLAADVYTNPQHAGRGGWTWYTGSAGWMYRLITESLLGLRLEVNRLRIEPVFPSEWESFDMHYRYRETFHHIHVRNLGPGRKVTRVLFDGVEQPDKTIPLYDDRQDHHAEVEVGGETSV